MRSVYHQRSFRNLGVWEIEGHRLKAYGITTPESGGLAGALVDEARHYAERVLPDAAQTEGEPSGWGYSVIHRGSMGTWLLVHWWAHGDICCGRLALAPNGSTTFESTGHRPLLACVWEQRVMQHECGAWVRHMMTKAPDPAAYENDRLNDGLY